MPCFAASDSHLAQGGRIQERHQRQSYTLSIRFYEAGVTTTRMAQAKRLSIM